MPLYSPLRRWKLLAKKAQRLSLSLSLSLSLRTTTEIKLALQPRLLLELVGTINPSTREVGRENGTWIARYNERNVHNPHAGSYLNAGSRTSAIDWFKNVMACAGDRPIMSLSANDRLELLATPYRRIIFFFFFLSLTR